MPTVFSGLALVLAAVARADVASIQDDGDAMALLQRSSPAAPAFSKLSGGGAKASESAGAIWDAPCLCIFDVDRTLTGSQGDTKDCPSNEVLDASDSAYDGGKLTLSEVGQSRNETFCAKCYLGVITAGDASGYNSQERQLIVEHLKAGGGTLLSDKWSGPSAHGGGRRACKHGDATTPLVTGCADMSKQNAVPDLVKWYEQNENVTIRRENVWLFDDRSDIILPFTGTGYNARQISCASRNGDIGLCGAETSELVDVKGVVPCYKR